MLFAFGLHLVCFACLLLQNYTKRHEKAPGAARKSCAEGENLHCSKDFYFKVGSFLHYQHLYLYTSTG